MTEREPCESCGVMTPYDGDMTQVDARLTCAVIEVERPDGYIERMYLSETEAEIVEDELREAREVSE